MSKLFRLNSVATSSSSIQNPDAKWTFRRKCRLKWMKALNFEEEEITVEALRWRRHLDQPNKYWASRPCFHRIVRGKSDPRRDWRYVLMKYVLTIRSCYSSSKTQLFRDNMVSSSLNFANKKLLQPAKLHREKGCTFTLGEGYSCDHCILTRQHCVIPFERDGEIAGIQVAQVEWRNTKRWGMNDDIWTGDNCHDVMV